MARVGYQVYDVTGELRAHIDVRNLIREWETDLITITERIRFMLNENNLMQEPIQVCNFGSHRYDLFYAVSPHNQPLKIVGSSTDLLVWKL